MNFFEEIKKNSGKQVLKILKNNNPYRILLKTESGLISYYFSVPIYGKMGEFLIPEWRVEGEKYVFEGSNAKIEVVENQLFMSNEDVHLKIRFKENTELEPTYNGVLVRSKGRENTVIIEVGTRGVIRATDSCFSVMKREFLPYFSVSGIMGISKAENGPLVIKSRDIDKGYELLIEGDKESKEIMYEINLYTPKLIFDTTVESNNPQKNNVYGGVAFIGQTKKYGSQWLYARINSEQLQDLRGYLVENAKLYVPEYFGNGKIVAYELDKSWCSFGMTWESRVSSTEKECVIQRKTNYQKIDITAIVRRILRLKEPRNAGIILKSEIESSYNIISTGDNCYRPQILKIKLKKD